jgi:hypothetical protein
MRDGKDILRIPVDRPDRMFGEKNSFEETYKSLIKTWHPDVSKEPNATDVFAHINACADHARKLIADGIWGGVAFSLMPLGTKLFVPYLYKSSDDNSEIYIADGQITYVYDKANREIAKAFHHYRPVYLDHKMATEFVKALPVHLGFNDTKEDKTIISTKEDKTIISIRRDPGLVRLVDLHKHVGEIPAKHLLWIVSVGINLCCYLNVTNQFHGSISEHTLWVDPQQHTGALLGGWGFHSKLGLPISKLPATTVSRCSWIRTVKKADPKLDISCVKEMALRLAPKDLNPEIRRWLMMPSSGDPLKDYARWYEVITSAFGKRSFTKWDVKAEDVYK